MLITVVVTAGCMLGAGAAFANSWAFDDPYWKQPETVGSVQATQADQIRGRYHQVDGYNP
jgi:hypothetical protein